MAVLQPTWDPDTLHRLAAEYFPVTGMLLDGGRPAFTVQMPPDGKERFLALRRRLEPVGLLPLLRNREGVAILGFVPRPPRSQSRWTLSAALFAATLVTTFVAGYINAQGLAERGYLQSAVTGGLAFSLSLMAILLTHEMGHKVFSILRGVDSSWPYFIPMIPPLGTMGAVIVTRVPPPNRDALIDVGAAGPIAGFLVAVPIVIFGVLHSFMVRPTSLEGINLPDPLLLQWIVSWLLHPPGNVVVVGHPMLFAGWIGLLVTSLNLLPASMLDGGHAVRALLGGRIHRVLSWVGIAVAVALGFYFMAALIFVMMRRNYPGPLDDVSPASPSRVLIGVLLVAIFIVSVVPMRIPLR